MLAGFTFAANYATQPICQPAMQTTSIPTEPQTCIIAILAGFAFAADYKTQAINQPAAQMTNMTSQQQNI